MKTIALGIFKGREITILKKKAREGFVFVKIKDGPTLEIHKLLIK